MGNDKHESETAAYIPNVGKNHLFHLVPEDFPLPEAGMIRLPFFQKYDRYAIMPSHLILGNKKLSSPDSK